MKGELLLIEDNPDTQMIVRKILERQEYSIRTANDGFSGLKLIEDVQRKLVLLDISLPEMDGMEIARRIRQHENQELRNTVLIALTAMGTSGDRDRFFDAGCDDHLPKPFRAIQLVEMVQVYMSDNFVPGGNKQSRGAPAGEVARDGCSEGSGRRERAAGQGQGIRASPGTQKDK